MDPTHINQRNEISDAKWHKPTKQVSFTYGSYNDMSYEILETVESTLFNEQTRSGNKPEESKFPRQP